MFLWVFVFFLITYNVWALFVCLPCGTLQNVLGQIQHEVRQGGLQQLPHAWLPPGCL